jgi:hypothetical protein
MKYYLAASALIIAGSLTQAPANACETVDVCKDILWCMDPSNGHEFAQPLKDAAAKGDGQGIGADAGVCQHKYGQHGPRDWDAVDNQCSANDHSTQGKKAASNSCG